MLCALSLIHPRHLNETDTPIYRLYIKEQQKDKQPLTPFIKTWQTYKSCANIRTMYCTMKREETCRETTR